MSLSSSYRYRAATQAGSIQDGRISAVTPQAAAALLSQRGLLPLEVVPVRQQAPRRRIALGELAVGLRVLADLLGSGLPVSRAITALTALAPDGWGAALPTIREAVREGKSLARALEESALSIPPEILGILHAGERGSGLASAARTAADLAQQSADSRNGLRAALAYPTILAIAGTLSAGLLVGVVLPRFAAILGDMGQSLPTSTRMVLGTGAVMRAVAPGGAVLLTIAAVMARRYTATAAGRATWHRALLAAPLIGDTRAAVATGRLCTTLAALLASGVPVAAALPHAAKATGDAAIIERVRQSRQRVVQGERLSHALAVQSAVTAVAARLIHAGEESGRLVSLLEHAGRLERERAMRRVQQIVRIIEPALIVMLGGMVAAIAASLLQALYSVRPAT